MYINRVTGSSGKPYYSLGQLNISALCEQIGQSQDAMIKVVETLLLVWRHHYQYFFVEEL